MIDQDTPVIPPELIKTLRAAHSVVVLTGAGVSAESGIPTFRQAQTGLWQKYRPEDLASPEAFRRNPGLVWDWYTWRRGLVSSAQPNAGHYALVAMEHQVSDFTLITQNVDDLHRRAGSRAIIELHGNILRTRCSKEGILVSEWNEAAESPPHCQKCGGLLRPDVVWFGEALPTEALTQAMHAAQQCQVFLAVGTSGLVYPAANLPRIALQAQAVLVEINPQRTELSSVVTYPLAGLSGSILPELVTQTWPK